MHSLNIYYLMRKERKVRQKMKQLIACTIRGCSNINNPYNGYTGILVKLFQSFSMRSTFRSMPAKLVHEALLNNKIISCQE